MVRKTLFFVFIAVVLLSSSLFAGGQQEGGTGTGKAVELTYWTHTHDPAVKVNETIIEEYVTANPNIKIVYDHVPHGDYETKLLTAFASGSGPDVYWIGDWVMPQFIPEGMVDEVYPQAYGKGTAAEVEKMFEPGALDAFKSEGKIYTAGISEYNTFSLFYGVDAFKEAGLEMPSKKTPMTFTEFLNAAKKMTKYEGGKRVRSGFEFPYDVPIWTILITEPWVRQLGGEFVNESTGEPQFTSEPVVKTWQMAQDLVFEHKTNDPAFVIDMWDDLANDRVATTIGGPWAIPSIENINPDFDYGVTPLPQFKGGERTTTLYAWAWMVNPKTDNREESWKFAADVATKHPDLWWNDVNYVQPLKGNIDNLVDTEPMMEVFNEDYPYGEYEFRSPQYYELSNILNRSLTTVMSENVDVKKTLQSAQEEAMMAVR